MSSFVPRRSALPLLLVGTLTACTTAPEVASIDMADRRVYARQGLDPVIAERLADAEAMAANSPTHRVQTRRLERPVTAGEEAPLTMPRRPLPEITAWGDELPKAAPLSDPEAVPLGAVSLPALVTVTLYHNGEIARAAESITGADLAAVNALFAYLPRISSLAEYSHVYQDVIESDNEVFRKGTADFPVFNVLTEIRQPVLDFPRLFGIREADTGRSVARAAYLGVVQGTIFDVVNSYVAALDNKLRVTSVEARIELLEAQIEAEERLLAAGRSIPSARQLLEIELGSAALERTEYAENFAVALAELSRLVGRTVTDVADFDLPSDVWDNAGSGPVQPYLEAALRDNPLIKQRRIETLQRRQGYQERLLADFSPTVEAFARQEYEDREESRFGGGSETLDHTFGVQLTVPIFNVAGQGYRSREQLSELRQAVIAEAQLRRELEAEIPTLIMRLRAQRESMQRAADAVRAAERLVESAEAGVRTGMSPEFAVIMQRLQLERAREWASRTRFTFVRSWVRLAYLTGSDAFLRIEDENDGMAASPPAAVTIGWLEDWQAEFAGGSAAAETASPASVVVTDSPHAHWEEVRTAALRAGPHAFWNELWRVSPAAGPSESSGGGHTFELQPLPPRAGEDPAADPATAIGLPTMLVIPTANAAATED